MTSLNFQSFLIIGSKEKRRAETKNLLGKINPDKISPDISIVAPLKQKVTIDQVREVKRTIFQKPVSLPYKVVIIEEAEKLTLEAQNALLKILEEPPKSAVIILEAKDKSPILPTILSRVVTLKTEEKRPKGTKSILTDSKNTLQLLEEVSAVENPQEWLDEQMLALYNSLQKSAGSSSSSLRAQRSNLNQIQTALEQCALAKQMIEANVNPRHVLANLVLNLQNN
ncbi:hypothetical protein HYW40_03190 [Candidatus Curtissbacteria bacterium]|nr:hypothetical protein [Candidatus Curtissbacteria bacterium]